MRKIIKEELESLVRMDHALLKEYIDVLFGSDVSSTLDKDMYGKSIATIKIINEIEKNHIREMDLGKQDLLDILQYLNIDSNVLSIDYDEANRLRRCYALNDLAYMSNIEDIYKVIDGTASSLYLIQNTRNNPIFRRIVYQLLYRYVSVLENENLHEREITVSPYVTLGTDAWIKEKFPNIALRENMEAYAYLQSLFYYQIMAFLQQGNLGEDTISYLKSIKYMFPYVNTNIEKYMLENQFGMDGVMKHPNFTFLPSKRVKEITTHLCFYEIYMIFEEMRNIRKTDILNKELINIYLQELAAYASLLQADSLQGIRSNILKQVTNENESILSIFLKQMDIIIESKKQPQKVLK